MPEGDFFRRFGCFAQSGALAPELCGDLLDRARSAAAEAATVYRSGMGYQVEESFRRTRQLRLEPPAEFVSALETLTPGLEAAFGLEGLRWTESQFLHYRTGDFFRRHRDALDSQRPDASQFPRRISVVAFLNEEEVDYAGGALTLYGLVPQPEWRNVGFALRGRSGMVFAFRSEIEHEVTPVLWGERFTVVSWLG